MPGAELITKIAGENYQNTKQLISVKSSIAMPIGNRIAEPFLPGSVPTSINSFEEFHNWSSGSLSASIQNGSNRLAIFSLQDSIPGSQDPFVIDFSSTTSIFNPNLNIALK